MYTSSYVRVAQVGSVGVGVKCASGSSGCASGSSGCAAQRLPDHSEQLAPIHFGP